MVALQELQTEASGIALKIPNLGLESTLQELPLHNCQIENSHLGKEVAQTLEDKPLLPGVILTEQGQFVGMISRRRFLEQMSRPYGLELFLKRPLKSLYSFVGTDNLVLTSDILIVEAARQSLQRRPELLYEPIVVQLKDEYYLLDVHQLLIAQSKIHELTTKLLHEQTQTQIIQTEKMASLGRMVAGIAHEIRNPVNCISGNFEFLSNYCLDLLHLVSTYETEAAASPTITQLKENIELDFLVEDLPKILESIKFGSECLREIVGSLRNFSHVDEAKRPADLHECLDSTLLILNNQLKHGIQVSKNYGDLPLVNCYSGQMSQVFMNLISNAIDALEEVRVTKSQFTPTITISSQVLEIDNLEWVSIEIADNGVGIPLAVQERIFETFFTTKPVGKGTGLGLAISYQIVTEKHEGKICLHSQPNLGAQFQVLLPI